MIYLSFVHPYFYIVVFFGSPCLSNFAYSGKVALHCFLAKKKELIWIQTKLTPFYVCKKDYLQSELQQQQQSLRDIPILPPK